MKRYFFLDPSDLQGVLQPDPAVAGGPLVPIPSQPDTHPDNGAPCISFDVTGVITGRGATLTLTKQGWPTYNYHGILDTVTPGGGGFDVDVFRVPKPTGGVRPFRLDGQFCRYNDDGTELLINCATGFRAFSRFVNGEASHLDAFMQSCVNHRINMIRVTAMQDTSLYLTDPALRFRIHPHDHLNFFQLVDAFMDYTAEWGVYVKWVLCTQTETILPNTDDQVRYVQGMFDVLRNRYCFVSKVNEQYQHDNTIRDAARLLVKPTGAAFLLSTGSKGSGDETAIDPIVDYIEYHTNDAHEWWRKGGHNSWEMANRYRAACFPSEETRTDKDSSLIHFEDAGKSEAAMCLGTMIHTPEGKNADPFGFSVPHIEAHNQGVFAVPIDQRRGPYARYENPAVLRDYSMGTYRWQVRF